MLSINHPYCVAFLKSISVKWIFIFVWQVFGDMAVSGMDKDMKNALDEGAQTLEKKTETPAAPKVCHWFDP